MHLGPSIHHTPGCSGSCCVLDCSLIVGSTRFVELAPNQVMSEMVLDGGGHFILAGIFGLHTLSLLLASRAAHHRATEGTRTHTGKEHPMLYH